MIGNMRPLLRLPLCASASISLPVFSSAAAIHFHRSRGLSLPSGFMVVNGSTRAAFAPFSRKMMLRCRLLPPEFDVYSQPIKAVNRPGSLGYSVALMSSLHVVLLG